MSMPADNSTGRIPWRLGTAWAVAAIALSVSAAYVNSLRAPFVFDDLSSVLNNPELRAPAFSPSPGTTLSGRPVAHLAFALNYAIGVDPWGFRAVNIVIHILSGVTLFGVIRRTLRRPMPGDRFSEDATPLALAAALLWSLHPLQTEAVTYIVQRVESLMGLFYLFTLYSFIRSVESPRPARWQASAVVSCLLGMGTKEVMATAPLVILLYDRTFVAGTVRKAWQQRRGLYLLLFATLIPEAIFIAGNGLGRAGSAGFGTPVSPWAYWLVQFEAVSRYLRLSLWPHPLTFDYGTLLVGNPGGAALAASVVVSLAALTLFAYRGGRHAALGFLGAWVFLILAPSSLVPVATQTVAEHRMYLPLAAVMVFVVLGVHVVAGRRSWGPLGILCLGSAVLTGVRNADYSSAVTLWRDTAEKRPGNARAHCSLGFALYSAGGSLPEAISEFEAALRIQPDYPDAQNDLGMALDRTADRSGEAAQHFREALRLRPGFAEAHYNLGIEYTRARRIPDAIDEYEAALRARPDYAEASNNLGNLLCATGRVDEGVKRLETAVRLNPNYATAQYDLGNALVQAGRPAEAIGRYEEALRIRPGFPEANNNLGMVLCRSGRMSEGVSHIEAAINAAPQFAQAHYARGVALMQLGRKDEAVAEFERVLQLRPNDPMASRMLEMVRASR